MRHRSGERGRPPRRHELARGLSIRTGLTLTGAGAMLATLVLFCGVAMRSGTDSSLPAAEAEPSPSPTSTTPAGSQSSFATDERGFVNSAARCDAGQVVIAFGRTQRSLVAICADGSGGYQYRGVRIGDGVSLEVAAEAASDDTYVASNDGAEYAFSPTALTVTSDGNVIYRDTWVNYQEPRLAAEAAPSRSAPSTAAPTTTPRPVG